MFLARFRQPGPLRKKRSLGAQARILIVACLLTVCALYGIYLGYLDYSRNFHTVDQGAFYRSAQLSANDLRFLQQTYGFKTILNLRGESVGKPWYDEEVAEAQRLGIKHINFRMSAKVKMSHERVDELIDILAKAEKPILVHCRSGSDRTGLASALYVATVMHGTESAAEGQLSLYYGHFGFPFSAAFGMDRTFESMEKKLGYPNS